MTNTSVPPEFADTIPAMEAANARLVKALVAAGLELNPYPSNFPPGDPQGVAAARAYPIQGVLKYHGMTDWDYRIAYLPSISVNNDAADTLTRVEFSPDLSDDQVAINGSHATGRERDRVLATLDHVRALAGIHSRAHVRSANRVRASRTGKGLGTSASASAALAAASLAAAFGWEAAGNTRLLSTTARLLAGSGCRSATGGLSLWLSYPGITHEDSFSVRLDARNELSGLRLITVPVDSRVGLKTELAHHDAPDSTLFRSWMAGREAEIYECIAAATSGDWRAIGELAELDSIRLHGITMSGSRQNKIFAWEPENIHLFRMCNTLRSAGVPVFFSTDTGPTTVFLTDAANEDRVVEAILGLDLGLEAIRGRLGGPAEAIDADEATEQLDTVNARGSSL